ncbi:MAG: hypothetical protein ACRDVC_08080 [Acidimicrobiales bacterium]
MNIPFVTLDQFRGDAYGAAGHSLVRTLTAGPERRGRWPSGIRDDSLAKAVS